MAKKKAAKKAQTTPKAAKKKTAKGGNPKLSKPDIVRDMEKMQAVQMYCQGMTLTAISAALDLSPETVGKHVKSAKKAWRESYSWKYDELLSLQAAKLDMVEEELWKAWENSKKPTITVTQEIITPEPKEGEPEPTAQLIESKKVVKSSAGDPRFLAGVLGVIRERSKLYRLYDPDQVEKGDEDTESMSVPLLAVRVSSREEIEKMHTVEAFVKMQEDAEQMLKDSGEAVN